MLSKCYLVCWGPGCLYFFHSASYRLAGWTEGLSSEALVHCDRTSLLVLREGGRSISKLTFTDVSSTLQQLVKLGLHKQANQVMLHSIVRELECGE